MKALSLFVSFAVFIVAGYFFVADFSLSAEANHFIYISLLLILMMICIVGIVLNVPLILQEKRNLKLLVNNKVGRKKNKWLQVS
jgi:membrane-bound acyltransferase YfiQ involved in biofilm formation